MVGSQFHPELMSRPMRPHPLFREFIAFAKRRAEASLTAEAGADVDRPVDPAGLLPA
jgi:CTP synthase